MNALIRKAEKKDSLAILNLIKELALFEKEPESVKLKLTDIENDGFGTKPLFECIVAEINERIIGMAIYYPRYSTWNGPTIHLEDLIVSEQYKGKGIGTQLYSNFIKMAFNSGVKRVEWNVLDWNSPAINFYKKSGAKVLDDWRSVQMHRSEMKKYLKNKEH
ncbi:GNAT family N-acetyltransferase [Bacteroidetes bacterium SCGC AAA795-G10]|nr:GNAT family N-acetyltransferase [Bacteroidetes bacterium SCGC AAA795-G10]